MKNRIFSKVTKRNYIFSIIIITTVAILLLCFNRESYITVFDEKTEQIELVHCALDASTTTNYSYSIRKNSILLSVVINKPSDWGMIAKNDYMWQDNQIDLQNYNTLRIRIKSTKRDFELMMIGFRTRKSDNPIEDEHLKNIGLMWSKIISVKDKGEFYTIDIPLKEFLAYEFDPVNQKYFSDIITSPYSTETAKSQNKIIFQELVLQPYSHIFGEREYEIDYVGFAKIPALSSTAVFAILIILTLVLLFLSVLYDYLIAIKGEELLTEEIEANREELYQAYEQLKKLDRAKTDFFANISHDLRTPLTLILSPVEHALAGAPLNNETLSMIERNGNNLMSLINDLLDVSQIVEGKMTLHVCEADLCDIVRQSCDEMTLPSKMKKIELQCRVCESPVNIYIDPKKIAQVISNLFSNSFKFTEESGVIEVKSQIDGDSAVLSFRDTGRGIPPEKLAVVFDRFSRCETGFEHIHEGTGIGLSIVKDIIELHGGTVYVESRYIKEYYKDHGTLFKIKIPLGKKHLEGREDVVFEEKLFQTATLPHVRGIELNSDNRKNYTHDLEERDLPSILIVEDNPDLRGLLVNLLIKSYNVFQAANGHEAIKLLEQTDEIDLVLSDIMMPGMDGHELLAKIRGDERFEGLPVVFLTARADSFMKLEGLGLGAVDYITKPFNSAELLLRIKNQMEQKKLRNRLRRNYQNLMARLNTVKVRNITSEKIDKIENACDFIRENYMYDLTRDELASSVEINPDTFSRLFNQHTGKALNDYINEIRIKEAKIRLAKSSDSITRVCTDIGYDNVRTFNRAFKKITGITPGEFRGSAVLEN